MPIDATTFSLEAPLPPPALWSSPRQALRRLCDPRVQRFAFFGFGAVLATGGATALLYDAGAGGWWLTLVAGIVLLARAAHLWSHRPFLRVDERALTFRLEPGARKHTVHWSAIERLDTEMTGARLHREDDALPGDTAHRLTEHLGDTARAHGVPVYPG